jgi:hypothetical protein
MYIGFSWISLALNPGYAPRSTIPSSLQATPSARYFYYSRNMVDSREPEVYAS